MVVSFNQVPVISAGETQVGACDLSTLLTTGATITRVPTVSQVGGSDLTISSVQATTSAITVDRRTIPIGRAVTYQVAGMAANKRYTVEVVATSTDIVPQTIKRHAHFRSK